MIVFRGRRNQRGSGIGSVFAGWLRRAAVPLLSKGLRYLTGKLANTGLNVAQDIHSGRNVGEAFKSRFKETGHNMKRELAAKVNKVLSGEGMLARRIAMKKKKKKKKNVSNIVKKNKKRSKKHVTSNLHPFSKDLF